MEQQETKQQKNARLRREHHQRHKDDPVYKERQRQLRKESYQRRKEQEQNKSLEYYYANRERILEAKRKEREDAKNVCRIVDDDKENLQNLCG